MKAPWIMKTLHTPYTPYYIYGLVDPLNNKIKYIGKAKNPQDRFKSHLLKPSPLLSSWFTELKKIGKEPILTILETVEKHNVLVIEKSYIEKYKDNNLFNINSNSKNSPEHLREIIKQKNREIENLKHTLNIISGEKGFQQMVNKIKKELKEELIQQFIDEMGRGLICSYDSKFNPKNQPLIYIKENPEWEHD